MLDWASKDQHLLVENHLSGNVIEQTAKTYKISACTKAFIKTSKPNLSNDD
jgi:hypothetical protein